LLLLFAAPSKFLPSMRVVVGRRRRQKQSVFCNSLFLFVLVVLLCVHTKTLEEERDIFFVEENFPKFLYFYQIFIVFM
jgi:hypothetical protein